jgi:hypothetical protein
MDNLRALSDEDIRMALYMLNRALENAKTYGTKAEIKDIESRLQALSEEFHRRLSVFRLRA